MLRVASTRRSHRHVLGVLRALLVAASCVISSAALSDTIKLKNGEVIEGKVIKEMDGTVKVRKPYRGRIVTTFLNKAMIATIDRMPDTANRKIFQSAGVRNPSRTFEPVYYSGVAAAGGGKGGTATPAGARKRGVDARRERFDQLASKRGERFGRRGSKAEAAAAAPATQPVAASPATTASVGTTTTGTSTSFGASSSTATSGPGAPIQ